MNGIKKDGWQKKYEDEHAAFESFKSAQSEKDAKNAKEAAYRDALISAGIPEKRVASIIRLTDLSAVEIGEDGKLKDAAGVDKSIREEWADMITTQTQTGVNTPTPPNNSGKAKGTMTRAEIMAIKDADERQKAIAANPGEFNITI